MFETKRKLKGSAIVVFIIVIAVLLFLFISMKPKWTLMVCDEVMDNGVECYSIYRTQELGSKETCMASGRATQKTHPVFECGKNCKHDGNFWLCDEICNQNGLCHQ